MLVSNQLHIPSSHKSGYFSLACHCGATLTEGRGEADSPGATRMRYTYSQWITHKIRINLCVANKNSDSPFCNSNVVPVRPAGKFY